jgi:hypothetical protein
MNIAVSANNLHEATKKLAAAWEQTKAYWRDVKSIEFEARYLEHLPNDAARAVAVMAEIDALLKKVRSDCE